jgi:hypothetical protein
VTDSTPVRSGRGPLIMVVVAAVVLAAGIGLFVAGSAAKSDAEEERDAARAELAAQREDTTRAEDTLEGSEERAATLVAAVAPLLDISEQILALEAQQLEITRAQLALPVGNVDEYNRLVGEENALIDQVNALIDQFNAQFTAAQDANPKLR